jgi:hypothetical protein
MFKKIMIILAVLCLSILPVIPVHALSSITVSSSSTQAQFPSALTFKVSAQSSVQITEIRLQYTVEQLSFAIVTSEAFVQFTPSTSVTTEWKWDMVQSGGLPPGTVVTYWWVIKDATGNILKTVPAQVTFDDTRFSWQKITQGKVTILWYSGQQSFADDIMSTAQQAIDRLTTDTGAYLKEAIRIYIYANTTDLKGSMIFPQEWTGGVAFTEYSCIAIGISPSNLAWGKRAVAHELTHLVTHQMTFNPYNNLPTWLEEGIAMYNEGPMQSQFSSQLNSAISSKSLISLQTLSSPFSTDSQKSYLSYAESDSVVDFLINTYGKDKMFQLLDTFRQGSTYDGALKKVYGLDTKGLNAKWQMSLLGSKTSEKRDVPFAAKVISLSMIGAIPLAFGITLVIPRRKR